MPDTGAGQHAGAAPAQQCASNDHHVSNRPTHKMVRPPDLNFEDPHVFEFSVLTWLDDFSGLNRLLLVYLMLMDFTRFWWFYGGLNGLLIFIQF